MACRDDTREMICDCMKYLVIKSWMFRYQIMPINWSLQRFCTVVNGIVLFEFTRCSDPENGGWYEIHGSLIIIFTTYTIYMHHTRRVWHLNLWWYCMYTLHIEVKVGHSKCMTMHYKENDVWTGAANCYTLLEFYSEILLCFLLSILSCHIL